MTDEQKQSVAIRMHALDDDALRRIVTIDRADWQPEAILIALEEIQRRQSNEAHNRCQTKRRGADGFCQECLNQTSPESPGDTRTVNFLFGTRLIGHDERCNVCGSVVQTLWTCVVLPIISEGRYRVRYLESGLMSSRYVGRKLLDVPRPTEPNTLVIEENSPITGACKYTTETIGIETVHGVFFPVLKSGTRLPGASKIVLSLDNARETRMSFAVTRGNEHSTKGDCVLGRFSITGISSEAGDSVIEITIGINKRRQVLMAARDPTRNWPLRIASSIF